MLITLFVILLLSVLSTASCSIGLQCLNKSDADKKGSNYGYLSFILGVSVLAIIGSVGFGVYKLTRPPAASVASVAR